MAPYKRKTDRVLLTAETLEEAKRKLEAGKSKREVARELGINECTLRKRLKTGTVAESLGRYKKALTDEMERELAQHCRDLDSRFYGLTRKHIMKVAFDYAQMNGVSERFNQEKKMAGKDWLKSFCKRNNLSVRAPENCSMARAIGFNRVQVSRFYDNLKECCIQKKFPAHRKFNVDETGLSTVPSRTPKVLTPKGKKTVCKIASAERGITVTAVCCMSATGVFVPPALIFPRKRMNPSLFTDAPPGTLRLVTDTGYMNSDLFLDWLKHFVQHTKPSADDPVLLIADNHSTHCSLQAILYCRENNVTFLTLPPHASHIIQPLDKCFYGPLKSAFSTEAEKWLVQHPGEVIKLRDVAGIFKEAYSATAKIKLAEKGFKVTGIEPFNPDIIDDELFAPSLVTEQPQSQNEDETANLQDQVTDASNPDKDLALPLDIESPEGQQAADPLELVPEAQIIKSSTQSSTIKKSIHLLLPLPKREVMPDQKGKRPSQKSEIITSSPFKAKLENKEKVKLNLEKEKLEKIERIKANKVAKKAFLKDFKQKKLKITLRA
ncbi:uncharacterized protein LOC129001936 [Macrosteles quadrilineatus]|uniref:uncharacterized protein LOC129001936 n=1 Tax=Macrosteles quadrilineatus TaxID=74068 RepID=UPI0023E0FBD8|nr:uncharacterized protein LOC129001936 [Macrosteles quadrilineatus]XP_054285351.1 uncharacterized protein LOC129001936 [Macrosteles quadrilineatus]